MIEIRLEKEDVHPEFREIITTWNSSGKEGAWGSGKNKTPEGFDLAGCEGYLGECAFYKLYKHILKSAAYENRESLLCSIL